MIDLKLQYITQIRQIIPHARTPFFKRSSILGCVGVDQQSHTDSQELGLPKFQEVCKPINKLLTA